MNDKSELKILSGGSNLPLATQISRYLDHPLTDVTRKPFTDGEIWVQINENVRGKDVYIIQSTNTPVNDNLMELLVMIDAAKRASAERVTAVIPFFGYARADRKDRPRISITAKLVANLLTTAGANRIITMDLHAPQIAGFFDIPVDNLFASPVMLNYFKGSNNRLFVLSPDAGGLKRAAAFAEVLGAPMGFASKKRKDEDTVETSFIVGNVKGRDVLILDDMTESLGTLISAAKTARANGAASVRAAVTHGVFNEKGLDKICSEEYAKLFDEFIITNTVDAPSPDPFLYEFPAILKLLDVAPLFAEAILRTYNGDSVTELFEIKGL